MFISFQVYIILAKPERNVRSAFTTSTVVRMHVGDGKSSSAASRSSSLVNLWKRRGSTGETLRYISVCFFNSKLWQAWFYTYNLQCEEIILLISSTSLHLLWYPPEGSRNWHGRLLLRPHRSMFLRYCQSQQTLIKHNIFKINMVYCKWICGLLYLW